MHAVATSIKIHGYILMYSTVRFHPNNIKLNWGGEGSEIETLMNMTFDVIAISRVLSKFVVLRSTSSVTVYFFTF
jgi:hypothetical protein